MNKTVNRSTSSQKPKLFRLLAGALIFAAGIVSERLSPESAGIIRSLYAVAFIVLGGDVIYRALKSIIQGRVFDENFLMGIATTGAFFIGETAEAVGVMLFYQVGESFQETAVKNSKKSISSLMNLRPDCANLKRDGSVVSVPPDTVAVGDLFVVKPGEKIPLDGVVVEGSSMLDTSALTGEPVPRKAGISDTVLSGCVNQSGLLTIKVTKTFGESTVSKIISLVENAASKKAKTENFITSFARYYTPAVTGLAVLIAVMPPLFFRGSWQDWINRGLIFLVISCPCALVLSIPMSFFAGIGKAAKNGILIKGGNFLEAFNRLETVVFDKTGTLTKGVFKVTEFLPAAGFSKENLLELAAHAEVFSNHPIALSIMKEFGGCIRQDAVSNYTELAGYGVSVNLGGKIVLAGNRGLMEKQKIAFEPPCKTGTTVYIASDGVFAGCLVISDEIKPDSRRAVSSLKAMGIKKTVMLTGDNPETAGAIAGELGLDEAYGGLLPHEKVEKLEILNRQKPPGSRLAFAGDGINDAPVLAMADIGIAMGAMGSDAAIEAADVVLMTDEPSKIPCAIGIARFTRRIVWQNIIFALGVKTAFLLLGAFGIASMWEAVFADVGVCVLAIFNSMRILSMNEPSLLSEKVDSKAACPAKTGKRGLPFNENSDTV